MKQMHVSCAASVTVAFFVSSERWKQNRADERARDKAFYSVMGPDNENCVTDSFHRGTDRERGRVD